MILISLLPIEPNHITSVSHPTAYELGNLLDTYKYSRSASIWLGIRVVLILFGGLILVGAVRVSSNADLPIIVGVGGFWLLLSILAIVEWRNKYLYSQALKRYQQGEIVSFGKLGISHVGLHIGQKTLPLSQLRDITVQDGSVRIRQQGKWLAWQSVAVSDVANIHVAYPFIEEITGHEGTPSLVE